MKPVPKIVVAHMKKSLLLIGFYFTAMMLFAQQSQSLKDNEPQMIDGIELGFRINKESSKKAGDDEYSRYVLEVYAINKSDCSKYIYYRNDGIFSSSSADNLIATFYVRNANGKRFTSREAKVNAKDWWVRVKVTEKDNNGKDVTRLRDLPAGYIFRRGDQLRNQITVLVPKGEQPNVEVALRYISE
jgi:hypothetical protein